MTVNLKKNNNCAFKHEENKTEVVGTDLENKLNLFAKEIESLNNDIMNLKSDVNNKEKELYKNKIEVQELNKKLALLTNNQLLEKDIMTENAALKNQVEILERENKALKIELVQRDKIEDEISVK